MQSRQQETASDTVVPIGDAFDGDPLATLCEQLFEGMTRSDQRRWGEAYVRGLTTVEGHKTISRISRTVLGRSAEQNLQQFVNQSPWDWAEVRRRLARTLDLALRPQAWLLDELALPKHGRHSVGVEKQFSHSEQRMLNCQLAMAAFLVGWTDSCPVDFRLMLPPSWDDDPVRRRGAHVPDGQRSRPRLEHALDLLDELTGTWELPRLPVLYDARPDADLDRAVRGMERRNLRHLIRVAPHTPLAAVPDAVGAGTVEQFVAQTVRMRRPVRTFRPTDPRVLRATTVCVPVPGDRRHVQGAAERTGPATAAGRERPTVVALRPVRHLVATWHRGQRAPHELWLTDLPEPWLPSLPDLIAAQQRLPRDLERLAVRSGILDFEGRSYRGWHHHATLASVAHGFHALQRDTEAGLVDGAWSSVVG